MSITSNEKRGVGYLETEMGEWVAAFNDLATQFADMLGDIDESSSNDEVYTLIKSQKSYARCLMHEAMLHAQSAVVLSCVRKHSKRNSGENR